MASSSSKYAGLGKFLLKGMIGIPIPIYLGVIIGQYMPVGNLMNNFNNIDWFSFKVTEYTSGTVMLMIMLYAGLLYMLYTPSFARSGEEYGSAKWGKWQNIIHKYANPENKDYENALKPKNLKKRLRSRQAKNAIPDMQAVTSTNRILSKHCKFDINVRTSHMNANTICIGSPGSWKTTSIVYTNVMNMAGSMVICDPKGETCYRVAGFCENAGYDVKILDLQDPDNSDCFNPFEYVKDDEDIPSMVSFAFRGFDADKSGTSKDPFWDDANMLEICAICYLLWYDARKEDQTLSMAMELVNLNSVEIKRPNGEKKTGLQWCFSDFADKYGENNMPMTYFKMFNKAKDKTLANMETTLVAKMQMLLQPKVKRLLSHDDLKLHDIGRKKQILFLKVPDANSSYNFIVSMLYMFLYKALYEVADVENQGKGCPIPITILEDEFTSFPQPDNFLSIMAGCRSRNVGIFPIFQDIPRLKMMKCLGEGWSSIFGQIDSWVFLGSQEPETCKFVCEQLNKETITVRTQSKQGYSENKTGRDLLAINEITSLPKTKCIVKIAGEYPILDDKYPFLQHPNIKLTAIPRDGSGIPLYQRKKNVVGERLDISVVEETDDIVETTVAEPETSETPTREVKPKKEKKPKQEKTKTQDTTKTKYKRDTPLIVYRLQNIRKKGGSDE